MIASGDTYLIKQGTLLNRDFSVGDKTDILIVQGKIAAIKKHISESQCCTVIDADGVFLTSGWFDSHAHVYQHTHSIGIPADNMLNSGVTAVIDAGTAGAYNFAKLHQQAIQNSRVQIKAYLHISNYGISSEYGELLDMSSIDQQACIQVCTEYSQEILGLKARIDPRVCIDEEKTLQNLRNLGDITGKRIVVHASRSRLPLEVILSYFKEGDIFAHSYADKTPGIIDVNGEVKKSAWEAKARGVLFDLSHGNGNFSFEIAKQAYQQNFYVDTISTDIHSGSQAKVVDIATTMTKMLYVGFNINEVLQRVINVPATLWGAGDNMTYPVVGNIARLTGFRLEKGKFLLQDSDGNSVTADQQMKSVFTVVENNFVNRQQI